MMVLSSRLKVHRSAESIAFDHYLRTGRRLSAGSLESGVEQKFNPNHDPADGRFTSGSGAATLREAAKVSRQGSLGPVHIVKLKPITDADVAPVHGLAATRSVTDAMDAAWTDSLKTGRENGFFIYYDGQRYYPGKTVPGTRTDMTSAFYDSLLEPDALRAGSDTPWLRSTPIPAIIARRTTRITMIRILGLQHELSRSLKRENA